MLEDRLRNIVGQFRQKLSDGSLRLTGCAIPLSALRYEKDTDLGGDQGIGDFGAIRHIIPWMSARKLKILQLLPINDTTLYRDERDAYPYSAISAFALNPIYADLNQLPLQNDTDLCRKARRLHQTKELHYAEVLRLKEQWLTTYFRENREQIEANSLIDDYIDRESDWLKPYALFCFKRDSEQNITFISDQKAFSSTDSALRYYYWLQWMLEKQLTVAVSEALDAGIVLKGDLPIGVSPNGVDVLCHPELFYCGMQAGAPPDYFSQEGQNWGFPTYNWQAMEREHYTWWHRRISRLSRFFAFLRIDHVLGFFRIWSIPRDGRRGSAGFFVPLVPLTESDLSAEGIPLSLVATSVPPEENALILPYPTKEKRTFTPRFNLTATDAFSKLDSNLQKRLAALASNFFTDRQEALWEAEGTKRLSAVAQGAPLILCAEDLGLTPPCVYRVLNHLGIMTLELERFAKRSGEEFSNASLFPYLSVATTATHDMPPLRMWWHQDPARAERFKQALSLELPIDVPDETVADLLIQRLLQSPSALVILPIQDWLSLETRYNELPWANEQINYPEDPARSWRYRLPFVL